MHSSYVVRAKRHLSGVTSLQSTVIVATIALVGVGAFVAMGTAFDDAIVRSVEAAPPSASVGGNMLAASGENANPTTASSATPPTQLPVSVSVATVQRQLSGLRSGATSPARLSQSPFEAPKVLDLQRFQESAKAAALSFGVKVQTEGLAARPPDSSNDPSQVGSAHGNAIAAEMIGPIVPVVSSGAFEGLSFADLAKRRGKLALAMEPKLKRIISLYGDGNLTSEQKAELGRLDAEYTELKNRDKRLEEAQETLVPQGSKNERLAALGAYLAGHLAPEEAGASHEQRLDDRRRLATLRDKRAKLVDAIIALKESGATVDEYKELQGKLAAIDKRLRVIVARDAKRYEAQIDQTTQPGQSHSVVMPKATLSLKPVGPKVSDAEAIAKYLRAKVAVTASQLVEIMPNLSLSKAQAYEPLVNRAMEEAKINTPQRRAAFLAQLAHESIGLTAFEEWASGSAYEWRTDLGNLHAGDGVRFKGRGPIQLTGRTNYRNAGRALGLDLEANPELVARPDIGFRAAAWFWQTRDLNELADAGRFDSITLRINGGDDGASARRWYWERAKSVLY